MRSRNLGLILWAVPSMCTCKLSLFKFSTSSSISSISSTTTPPIFDTSTISSPRILHTVRSLATRLQFVSTFARVNSDCASPSQPTATHLPSPTAARPLAPTSPVELWRIAGAKCTRTPFIPRTVMTMPPAGKNYIPPNRPASPGPLASDFFQQQVAKQRNNNYHSTSLRTMVATSVNRTALHPGGVQYVFPFSTLPLFVFATSILTSSS